MFSSETSFYFENTLQDVSEKRLFLLQAIITISFSENEAIIFGKEVNANIHLQLCSSHLPASCNSISYFSVSGFRSIHCVIICSSREIDENVNTQKQYLVSSDKTQYFLFLQMTWKAGVISTHHSPLRKNAQPCCLESICSHLWP